MKLQLSLRSHLVLLVLVALVPVVLFSAGLVVMLDRQERAAVERGLRETTRALAVALDQELISSITTLEALATSDDLDAGRLHAFYGQAARVLNAQGGKWSSILLADASGNQLLTLLRPYGAALPPRRDLDAHREAVATRRPVVSHLHHDPLLASDIISIEVPVVRDGVVKYVLSASVDPASAGRRLVAEHYPAQWIGEIFDGHGTILARTVERKRWLGHAAPREVVAASAASREGWVRTRTLAGVPVYAAFSRSTMSGWTVTLKIPVADFEAPLHRSLKLLASAGLGLALIAALLATLLGRRLARPIVELTDSATRLGEGRPLPARRSSAVFEVDQARRAVEAASALLEQRSRERDRAEAERGALLARAEEARRVAEAATRAKDEFLAVVSHELRTPLTAMLGWVRMLRARRLDAERSERALETIERNTRLQAQLINDLLDVSRIVTGKLELDRYPVDLVPVIQESVDAVRREAEAKAITIEVVLPHSGVVLGDPTRLAQVFANLLANAVKFTPNGGAILVDMITLGPRARVSVTDTGIGIDAELLPHIFDRFRQGDSTSTRKHGGLGLGLAIVRHLVELHDGHVRAESAGSGQGARFVVELPLPDREQRSHYAPKDRAETLSHGWGRLAGLRVLVVEDDTDTRELVRTVLDDAGARVTATASAEGALAALDAATVDVLISDLGLPDLDGYDLIGTIRERERAAGLRQLPAIGLTAYAHAEARAKAFAAGFQLYVVKPVTPGELIDAIVKLTEIPSRV